MWYLWKARNDHRFHRKTWNPWQVHHVVAAQNALHRQAQEEKLQNTATQGTTPLQGITIHNAGTEARLHITHQQPTDDAQTNKHTTVRPTSGSGMNCSMAGTDRPHGIPCANPMMHRFTVSLPALIPGVRCYTDASTTPDHQPLASRTASLGVFFVNTQVQPIQKIYRCALSFNGGRSSASASGYCQ
jgi:hypothetical protein